MIELKRGYDLPQQERSPGKVPLVSSSGVTDYHSVAMVKGPGVVTGRYGTLGQVFYITEDFWPLNTTLYVRDFKGNDPRFISYFLRSVDFLAYSDKAAVPGLNRNHLHLARVRFPVLVSEQRAIAHILGTLDDKIELNRRMNETLEAIARALFKSWFVDFDPVRAKAEGRDPGLPLHFSTLFPDRFEDSELGEIPAGWEVETLGGIFELAYGKALKEENRRPGRVAVFGSNGQVGWHDEKLVDGPGIVVGRKGNPGIVTWAPIDFFPIDTTFYVVPKGKCRSLYFLFHALRAQDLASLGADSAVPGLNRNLAYMNQQVVPLPSVLEAFDSVVEPLYQQMQVNDEQSHTLAALRDTLLPKLISGQLRVSHAERSIGGCL
jgi:type I restriction enzyme S subunit